MKILECVQRSPEWVEARLGTLTSTSANDMLSRGRDGKESAGRRNLRVRLALERLTGRSLERDVQTPAMRDGVEREYDAAATYEALTGRLLTSSGFLMHDTLMAGCSLDGHVGDFEGIVEIKSPIPATHLEYLRTGTVPTDYLRQVTHALWLTGAAWCDWLSFQPDFPEPLRVKLVRVTAAQLDLDAYAREATAFLAEVDRELDAIRTLSDLGGVLRSAVPA